MAAYAGYGGSPAPQAYGNAPAPQAYGQPSASGQPIPSPDKKQGKAHKAEDEKASSPSARLDNWCIFLCCMGGFLTMVATFVPLWRVDPHGTTELEKHFSFKGFASRSYGVIHVKGSWSQSWTTLAQSVCDVRNIGHLSGLAAGALSLVQDGDCAGSQKCQSGFASSMHMRCEEYQTMTRISTVTLTATFLGIVLVIVGTLVVSMSKRKKAGGIAFGLYMFAGLLTGITNATWALVSDNSFKRLSKSAWYPYPSLGAGYYLHLFGVLLLLICGTIFGFIVLPEVWKYDATQEKLEKKKEKFEKRQEREQQYAAKKQELQAIMAGQQAGAAPQPGYGPQGFPPPGCGPQGSPWPQQQPAPQGQPWPQQQPETYGQQAAGYGGYGQQPAPAPQAGYGAYGQQGADGGGQGFAGYAADPTQQYGGEAGYCAPPAGGYGTGQAGGYGAAPAGAYGAGPVEGYGAAPGPDGQYAAQAQEEAKPAYHWPAHSE